MLMTNATDAGELPVTGDRVGPGEVYAPKCRSSSDLQVLASRLRSAAVLVDHSAEDLPALHQCVQRNDGRPGRFG